MSERLAERAQRAGAAVHARTAEMDAERGLGTVLRRGRRPRPTTALAVLLVVFLAVPAAGWLRGLDDTRVEFGPPADAPGHEPATTGQEPEAPPSVAPEPDDDPTASPGPDGETDGGESGDRPSAAPEPEDSDAGVEPAPSGPDPSGPFGTEEVTAGDFPAGGGEQALLTEVRVAGHEGFDRVVLEFDGPDVPSYRVAYVEPPIVQDGSGDEIPVEGGAFLELRLTPASGVDSAGAEWEQIYHGPDRLGGDTAVVTEVVRVDDFEANLAWVVGLRTRQPFAVTFLSEPLRLVVDIRTG